MIESNRSTEQRETRTVEEIKTDLKKAEAECERARRAKSRLEAEYLDATAERVPKFF